MSKILSHTREVDRRRGAGQAVMKREARKANTNAETGSNAFGKTAKADDQSE
jgi:hypothetical protein